MARLLPHVDSVIRKVALYMSQFTFKAPTALQFVVIMLAEEAKEPRSKVQALFGC